MKKKWIIRADEVPPTSAIHTYILAQTDLSAQIAKFASYKKPPFLEFALKSVDLSRLRMAAEEAVAKYGAYPYKYQSKQGTTDYCLASLTFNPHKSDKISEDPIRSVVETSAFKAPSYYQWNLDGTQEQPEQNSPHLRNSIIDTYAFNEATEVAYFSEIGKITRSLQRPMIRSRLSLLKAYSLDATKFGFFWHCDEPIFLNLRLNVCIAGSPDYAFQVETSGEFPTVMSKSIAEVSPQEGRAYSWDTFLPHRVYCKKLSPVNRLHLVYGVSPWFDYDADEKTWYSNEFYGELHPFDMLTQGHISNLLEVRG